MEKAEGTVSMEERAQQFKDLLKELRSSEPEISPRNPQNIFFSELFKEPALWEEWLNFTLETILRIAASDKKVKAAQIARIIMGAFPTTRQYFPGKKLVKRQNTEYWLTQIRQLNLQYVLVTKALACMLLQHGELALSRQLFEQLDESLVQTQYSVETDIIKFGTPSQARKWRTIGDEMKENAEFAQAQQEKFEAESNTSFEDLTGEGKPLPCALTDEDLAEKIKQQAMEKDPDLPLHSNCRCTISDPEEEKDPTRLDLID